MFFAIFSELQRDGSRVFALCGYSLEDVGRVFASKQFRIELDTPPNLVPRVNSVNSILDKCNTAYDDDQYTYEFLTYTPLITTQLGSLFDPIQLYFSQNSLPTSLSVMQSCNKQSQSSSIFVGTNAGNVLQFSMDQTSWTSDFHAIQQISNTSILSLSSVSNGGFPFNETERETITKSFNMVAVTTKSGLHFVAAFNDTFGLCDEYSNCKDCLKRTIGTSTCIWNAKSERCQHPLMPMDLDHIQNQLAGNYCIAQFKDIPSSHSEKDTTLAPFDKYLRDPLVGIEKAHIENVTQKVLLIVHSNMMPQWAPTLIIVVVLVFLGIVLIRVSYILCGWIVIKKGKHVDNVLQGVDRMVQASMSSIMRENNISQNSIQSKSSTKVVKITEHFDNDARFLEYSQLGTEISRLLKLGHEFAEREESNENMPHLLHIEGHREHKNVDTEPGQSNIDDIKDITERDSFIKKDKLNNSTIQLRSASNLTSQTFTHGAELGRDHFYEAVTCNIKMPKNSNIANEPNQEIINAANGFTLHDAPKCLKSVSSNSDSGYGSVSPTPSPYLTPINTFFGNMAHSTPDTRSEIQGLTNILPMGTLNKASNIVRIKSRESESFGSAESFCSTK